MPEWSGKMYAPAHDMERQQKPSQGQCLDLGLEWLTERIGV